jgi:hypothetical protein
MDMPRITRRYYIELMADIHWRVVDLFTGQTTSAFKITVEYLSLDEAAHFVALLNDLERRRPGWGKT